MPAPATLATFSTSVSLASFVRSMRRRRGGLRRPAIQVENVLRHLRGERGEVERASRRYRGTAFQQQLELLVPRNADDDPRDAPVLRHERERRLQFRQGLFARQLAKAFQRRAKASQEGGKLGRRGEQGTLSEDRARMDLHAAIAQPL